LTFRIVFAAIPLSTARTALVMPVFVLFGA
jgi:hypothetical protein